MPGLYLSRFAIYFLAELDEIQNCLYALAVDPYVLNYLVEFLLF